MFYLKAFSHSFLHALKNLLPIVVVVVFFQLAVLHQVPDKAPSMAFGLLIVAVGVALFLQGLELSIFPIGKSLSNQFARRGSVPILLAFGFAIGFSAVVAEPALIAVAQQAQEISAGRIEALTLRLLVAISVGTVVALGVFRTIMGYPLHWFMIGGYITVVIVTWFAPEEIVGLAYDSGGVTTNVVTVPLVAALGIGLAASIRGRNPLTDGFGLVALAVMVPMITVQLYGILVHSGQQTDHGYGLHRVHNNRAPQGSAGAGRDGAGRSAHYPDHPGIPVSGPPAAPEQSPQDPVRLCAGISRTLCLCGGPETGAFSDWHQHG